ncbi:MAG: phosphopyruvate hydratase [Ureaplasma sp.]|nr:phosphopyruvate hydratase [Ureaplasma sp.]
MKITNIKAYQIYDSRGYPTIACKITLDQKNIGLSMVPSGASTGEKEACELRDNNLDWKGKGVTKAIDNINNIIAKRILNIEINNQKEIDDLLIQLDGTKNKNKLGANAILAVSLAFCYACSKASNYPLFKYISKNIYGTNSDKFYFPQPMINVLNGGKHANNGFDFQEIMLVPISKNSIEETLKIGDECFLELQNILKNKNYSIAKGDEGGFSIQFQNYYEPFELIIEAIKNCNYKPGVDVCIAIDVAASEFYNGNTYNLHNENKISSLTSDQLIVLYCDLVEKYPIISIEDPFDENDWDSFVKLNNLIGNKIQIVGDDLYCTNKELLKKGIDKNATNAILIKLNQIGTLSECLETIKLAQENNLKTIISHRSGETEDTFIADLSVATSAMQIKTGSFSRSERLAKYNRLLEIDATIEKLNKPFF